MHRLNTLWRPFGVARLLAHHPRIQARQLALPPSRADDTPNVKHNPYTREFPSTISQVAHTVRRFFKFSIIGILFMGSTILIIFQGAHLYVEKVSLASHDYHSDPNTADIAHYEWDKELDNWTSPPGTGGTDPNLSWKARYAVRSAWMSLHWGSGVVITPSPGSSGPSTSDGRLVPAQQFLNAAVQGCTEPNTRIILLELQGNIACALNSSESMKFALRCYKSALEAVPVNSQQAAKLLSRMAEVLHRMGQIDQSLDYHWKAVHILDPDHQQDAVPSHLPTSPLATRLLLRNLNAISMLYATSRDLKTTSSIQIDALRLASSLPHRPEGHVSPAQRLHRLFVQQRIATLQLHHAEVLYAISRREQEPLKLLNSAAATSESIALTLLGKDPGSVERPDPPTLLSPAEAWTSSMALTQPSRDLLLDASRSAASAYHLSAILHEKQGKSGRLAAFQCLEKAIWWCGGVEGPGEDIPLSEWETIWKDYRRLRGYIHADTGSD